MHVAPPPSPRDLLPPLLACLPTSFVAPRPPPALLPLLSPLLRQRVNFLQDSSTGSDGWLPLLAWDQQRASKLPAVIERMDLEPHPVSGELELEEVRPAKYRRLDEETLQSRLAVEQFDLLPIYVWCEKDDHGGTEPGWKLSELRTLDDAEDGTDWFDSPAAANDAASSHAIAVPKDGIPAAASRQEEQEDDLNDDYWASYDRTSAERTPAQKRSPAPGPSSTLQMTSRGQGPEMDYYSRYGEEVQPAMDSHDPDEDSGEFGDSTLNGGSLHAQSRGPRAEASNGIAEQADYLSSLRPHADWQKPHDSAVHTALDPSINGEHELSMPRPISPTNSHSSIDKLEDRAAEMSSSHDTDRTQMAVKQHISTDIKSLFRLAKASGMDRQEFERIVQRELKVLSLLEQDE